jgi:hypothetical protein
MNDFGNIMFVPDTCEFVDLDEYDIHDLVDQQANRIVGKIFIYKKSGREEYIQFGNGKVKRMWDMFEQDMDF